MDKLYEKLYKDYTEKDGKRGMIALEDAAVFVPMKGKKYNVNNDVRLMIVGRATNGWKKEFDYTDAASFGKAANICYRNNDRFGWIEEAANDGYFISSSSFWRVTKDIYNKLAGDDTDWINHIMWSNLYKISRQNANPTTTMCCAEFEACKELLMQEIKECEPTHIVFMTDYKYWIKDVNAGKNRVKCSFDSVLNATETAEKLYGQTIEAYGSQINGQRVKFVITCRPENKNEGEFVDAVMRCFEAMN